VWGELVGAFANEAQNHLRATLVEGAPGFDWTTEHRVGATRVDVGGRTGGLLVVVELEWRRADPATDTAKLFRHLESGALEAYEHVTVVQAFSGYYDLASGGVSSKRENAEFVGSVAEAALAGVTYHPIEFDLDPPKRGVDWPDDLREGSCSRRRRSERSSLCRPRSTARPSPRWRAVRHPLPSRESGQPNNVILYT
jgi:hypothetical protein